MPYNIHHCLLSLLAGIIWHDDCHYKLRLNWSWGWSCLGEIFFLKSHDIAFQKRGAPLATRICLALKNCFFGSRTHRRPSETGTPNDESTRYQDDVEMAYGATKTNSVLVDDGHFDETTLRRNRMMKRAEVIDSASRILFPLAFVVYNVYYWSYYWCSYWTRFNSLSDGVRVVVWGARGRNTLWTSKIGLRHL